MKLSINAENAAAMFGLEKALELFAQAGFDCYDTPFFSNETEFYSKEYKEYCRSLKQKADKLGIRCNQAHAPFASVKWGDDDFNKKRFGEIVRSMECASLLGAEIIVVHPVHVGKPKSVNEYEVNKEFYERLIPYCEKFNIKIATENMFNHDPKRDCIIADVCNSPERFVKMVDYIDSPWIVGCLDVGHCGLVGEDAAEMALALGHDRLKALHIHDNNYLNDNHIVPFMGKMDWDSICKALADINYDGVFTYESYLCSTHLPAELALDALKYMHAVGRYLINKIESFKK